MQAPLANQTSGNGAPEITGVSERGAVLTAQSAGISDDQGRGAFAFQWFRDGVAIDGATEATYTSGSADVETQLSVVVSFTDGAGNAETRSSGAVFVVEDQSSAGGINVIQNPLTGALATGFLWGTSTVTYGFYETSDRYDNTPIAGGDGVSDGWTEADKDIGGPDGTAAN